jgi:hypothetical protein
MPPFGWPPALDLGELMVCVRIGAGRPIQALASCDQRVVVEDMSTETAAFHRGVHQVARSPDRSNGAIRCARQRSRSKLAAPASGS